MDAEEYLAFARARSKAGEMQAAVDIVRQLLAAKPDLPEALLLLASLQYGRLAFDESEATFDRLVEVAPERLGAAEFQRLIKLKNQAGKTAEAQRLAGRALAAQPDNPRLIVLAAAQYPDAEANRFLAESAARLGDAHPAAPPVLRALCEVRARMARTEAGLPLSWALSWDDASRWPDPEGLDRFAAAVGKALERPTPAAEHVLDAAHIAVAQRQWDEAERFFSAFRANVPGTPADCEAFGAGFHAALDEITDDEMHAGLPAVQRIVEAPQPAGGKIFQACDPVYFWRFALPFLKQLESLGAKLDVHVHIMDGPAPGWGEIAAAMRGLSVVRAELSAEDSAAAARTRPYARAYYSSVRFIRQHQELVRTRAPVWMLDADLEAMRDPTPLMAKLDGADAALRITPAALDPMLKPLAGCVGLAPTSGGIALARRVAAYIMFWKKREALTFGVDQAALYSSIAHMTATGNAPKIACLGPDTMTLYGERSRYEQEGLLCFHAGISKYA